MVDFPNYKPDSDSTYTNEPVVLKAGFGDNYAQHLKDGLNAQDETWDLVFAKRSLTDITAIKTFLDTVSDVTPFNWIAPDEATTKIWRKDGPYKITNNGRDRRTLTVKFVRYYGP